MIGRRPLDPEAPHRAAPLFERLVAQDLLGRAEALDALLDIPTATRWLPSSRGARPVLGRAQSRWVGCVPMRELGKAKGRLPPW